MDVSYVFACLVVADRDKAAAWYQRLLGRPADLLPNDAEAMWQLTGSSSVYLLAEPGRAGQGALTVAVADLDAAVAELARRGITAGRAEVVGGAGRKCVIADPDGNQVALVELAG
ncbi:MAG TPA: VOC family protein [Streptosporangiaceae bacterium]|nr:VOC family protein [Streptosporangiaceae bacterium]